MMTQNADKKREQLQIYCMVDLVPQDHLLRLIDKTIDWSFIYGDREVHGKNPLKEKDDDQNPPPTGGKEKTVKSSITDPESGWFRKG